MRLSHVTSSARPAPQSDTPLSVPRGFTLRPDATARVFTGCGLDSADQLYWCNTDSAIWNNRGDTAFLLDPAGNIVHSYAYG